MGFDIEAHYRAYGPMVLRRCRRLLRDEGKAVDAMHDVFVEVLRRKDTLVEDQPARLLLRVATNVCLNRLRTERRHPEDADDALVLQLAAHSPDAEAAAAHRSLLARIFGAQEDSTLLIAVLLYVDRMTLEEVAAEVGMSVSGVRKRLRTLRERMPPDVQAAAQGA